MISYLSLFDLSKKVAIVTGGSQGIGMFIAKGLANMGADVAIVNRRDETGKRAISELKRLYGVNAISIVASVIDSNAVEAMVERVIREFGRIDILVNNAGIIIRSSIEQMSEKEWDQVLDTNLKGSWLCSRAVANYMLPHQKGKIINISSVASMLGLTNRAAYCASKGGVSALTRAMAVEWAKYNIQVNAIGPGFIQTEIHEDLIESDPTRNKRILDCIPMSRFGDPQDVANLAIFLASDASNYLTGQTIYIDGGWSVLGNKWDINSQ
jgi:NAD(P)-dependent dehydrogenase (short-subunit alcohol dehydrogenase family)